MKYTYYYESETDRHIVESRWMFYKLFWLSLSCV